jgi:3-hydroxyacyl-CoA dehydrogenase
MADMSGIDVFKHVSGTINAAYGQRCYNGTLGFKLFDAKRLGQKTGVGYVAASRHRPTLHCGDQLLIFCFHLARSLLSLCSYYKYVKGKPVVDATLQPLIDAARADAPNKAKVDASKLSDDEIVEATLFPVVNEALRIVEEGFALSESDVDVVSVMGYGFPAWRGGVLHWASEHPKGGYKYIRDRLQAMSQKWGGDNQVVAEFFKPCDLLNKKANGQK